MIVRSERSLFSKCAVGMAAVALALAASGFSPRAVGATEDLPGAAEILERFVQSAGGRDAMEAQEYRTAKGTFELPAQGIKGSLVIHQMVPNRYVARVEIPGVGEMATGYDGQVGWMIQPMVGPMVLEGGALEELKIQADFDEALKDPKRYSSLTTVGTKEIEGALCYEIRLELPSGKTWSEFYDVDNGLMLARQGEEESPMGKVEVISLMSNYTEAGGVFFPMLIRQKMMGMEQILTIERLSLAPLDESVFDLPEEIQALVEEASEDDSKGDTEDDSEGDSKGSDGSDDASDSGWE